MATSQRAFSLRVAGYVGVVAVCFEVMALAVATRGWEWTLRDARALETVQAALLGTIVLGASGLAARVPRSRGLYGLIACAALFMLVRELDFTRAYAAVPSSVRIAVAAAIATAVAVADRRNLPRAVLTLLDRPPALLFIVGAAMAICWAQLLGQPPLWRAIYADYGPGRRVAEEGLELAGYLFLVFGLVEERAYLRGSRRAGT
jgi:hypothetical protein